FLTELAAYIEEDCRRWELFDKTPRIASHSHDGVIELMPTSDGRLYGFKYVNGHPKNMREGRQTVTAFGVLADVGSGYPMLLSEMTILTALRTAATSALAAKYLAPKGARAMAIIGNGAQSEFQAIAFKALTGIEGEIQQLDADHPVTELWQVISGQAQGRKAPEQITLFDSVGFATEDFSALRYVRDQLKATGLYEELDLLADPDEPRDLFGM